MATIKIDGVEYNLDKISNEAKAQLASIQFCDQELQRLQAQIAVTQTARPCYIKALKELIQPKVTMRPFLEEIQQ